MQQQDKRIDSMSDLSSSSGKNGTRKSRILSSESLDTMSKRVSKISVPGICTMPKSINKIFRSSRSDETNWASVQSHLLHVLVPGQEVILEVYNKGYRGLASGTIESVATNNFFKKSVKRMSLTGRNKNNATESDINGKYTFNIKIRRSDMHPSVYGKMNATQAASYFNQHDSSFNPCAPLQECKIQITSGLLMQAEPFVENVVLYSDENDLNYILFVPCRANIQQSPLKSKTNSKFTQFFKGLKSPLSRL